MSEITRRTALAAAPAVALTAAVPGMAASQDGDSEIMRIFWRCVSAVDQCNASYGDLSPLASECQDAVNAIEALEQQLLAIPAETAQEMAAKTWVWSCYGTNGMDGGIDHHVIADASRLLGMDGRRSVPSAPPESEIMRLFREWKVYLDWCHSPVNATIDDDELDRIAGIRFGMEDRILAQPSRDAYDTWAKFLVITLNGETGLDFDEGERSGPIFDEARAFLGLTT